MKFLMKDLGLGSVASMYLAYMKPGFNPQHGKKTVWKKKKLTANVGEDMEKEEPLVVGSIN